MPVTFTPSFAQLRNKPTTMAGYGITDEKCKAWVNFNGTGTVSIRGSGNVSSITDNGAGDYTVNFLNWMPDANYSVSLSAAGGESAIVPKIRAVSDEANPTLMTVGQLRIAYVSSGGPADTANFNVAIFR